MIDLPEYPSPSAADVGLIDFGAILSSSLGGPQQRVNRLGNRFRIDVTMPPMFYNPRGRQWVNALVQAQTQGARMPLPLLDFDPGIPGDVLVDGAGQAGSTLAVRGATAGYAFRAGQFFSIETGGRHHVYMVTAETLADSSGDASLPITPMIRAQHLDGDACHFGKPMIEGFVEGDQRMWSLAVGNFIGLQFSIAEAA